MELNENFWTNRYLENETGWDIGYPAPPIIEFFEKHVAKDKKILIPGAGNCYEGEHLFRQGFQQVYILDWSKEPLDNIKKRIPEFPEAQLIQGDFFKHNGSYDYIVEQTFFCALNPVLRKQYVEKMYSLLKEKGVLVGLLFNSPLYDNRPPFGGNEEAYRKLFQPEFEILNMETARNSIKPRQGSELFIRLRKKS